MNILDLEQGSDAWHAWRATRRMASESSALLRLSPWAPRTPLQLFEVKSGLTHIEQNPAMLHGIVNEGRARELYERCGEMMIPHCIERDGYGASLDGISEDGRHILEIKCPVKGSASNLWKAGGAKPAIPEHYRAQVQHQLMVSGAESCEFLIYAADIYIFKRQTIRPDIEMQSRVRGAWDQFWPFYSSGTPPEPIEGDFVERFDAEWIALEAKYLLAKAMLKGAEAAEEKLRKELFGLAGDASCRGEVLRVTRYWSRGAVDYAKIPAFKGIDTEPYRKKGGYRNRISEVSADG